MRQQLNKFTFDATFMRTVHDAVLADDTILEDIVVPGYWGPVANTIRTGSIIEAHRKDWSLDVMLRVTHVELGLARVHVLACYVDQAREEAILALRADAAIKGNTVEEAEPVPAELSDYKIGFNPSGRFYVQFKPDKVMLKGGFASKAEAIKFAQDHKARAETV